MKIIPHCVSELLDSGTLTERQAKQWIGSIFRVKARSVDLIYDRSGKLFGITIFER